jgi:hypothetical protein
MPELCNIHPETTIFRQYLRKTFQKYRIDLTTLTGGFLQLRDLTLI